MDLSEEVEMSGDAYPCTDVFKPVYVNASDEQSGDGDEEGRESDSFDFKAAIPDF